MVRSLLLHESIRSSGRVIEVDDHPHVLGERIAALHEEAVGSVGLESPVRINVSKTRGSSPSVAFFSRPTCIRS